MWYLKNASEEMWSTTTLDRNISSQYFERRLAAQRANPDMKMTEAVAPYNDSDPLEYCMFVCTMTLLRGKTIILQ